MWWYKNKGDEKPGSPSAGPADGAPPGDPHAALAAALGPALRGKEPDPHGLLAMSLLVDSRVELTDGGVVESPTWQEAEKIVAAALATPGPVRLYNQFSKAFGDGYTRREDLPEAHRTLLDRLRSSLDGSAAISSVEPVEWES